MYIISIFGYLHTFNSAALVGLLLFIFFCIRTVHILKKIAHEAWPDTQNVNKNVYYTKL